jgi:hypothetical protein
MKHLNSSILLMAPTSDSRLVKEQLFCIPAQRVVTMAQG